MNRFPVVAVSDARIHFGSDRVITKRHVRSWVIYRWRISLLLGRCYRTTDAERVQYEFEKFKIGRRLLSNRTIIFATEVYGV